MKLSIIEKINYNTNNNKDRYYEREICTWIFKGRIGSIG